MPTRPEADDFSDLAVLPLARRGSVSVPGRLGPVTVASALIAILSLAALEARRPVAPAQASPPDASSGSAFVPAVPRPAMPPALASPRFRLDDPESLEPARAEPARLNPTSGQREDMLVQGGFSTIEAPYLRLTLAATQASEPLQSLFVTLARRAADGLGLAVIRTGERRAIETKFGPVETLDITLGGDGKRGCTGFATLRQNALRIDGWLCAPLGQPPEADAVVCALDKVALNGQASPEMERAFMSIDALRNPTCRPQTVTARDVSSETGSIVSRRTRKNEAKLRRSREARP